MTSFEIEEFPFGADDLRATQNPKLNNWPVVYVINDDCPTGRRRGQIYFGETLNFRSRMKQHSESPEKQSLTTVRVILDEKFNKSVCLDLESQLIKYAAGDGLFEVLNRNDGVVDADYYDRPKYREMFNDIFYELRAKGLFQRTIPQIINSELFKLSPFKALNEEQAAAVDDIIEGLAEDIDNGQPSVAVIQGDPGTGKTVVAIYLMKLLVDIAEHRDEEELDSDTRFSEFFLPGYRDLFQSLKIGIVVPQQALRTSVQNVFAKTPGLSSKMVLSTMQVGASEDKFDVLIVDEAHRLSQFAAQAMGTLTKQYKEINKRLFSGSKPQASQLDWLRDRANHVILLLDSGQSVRPGDIAKAEFDSLLEELHQAGRTPYRLSTQMRSEGGETYIDYVKAVFTPGPPPAPLSFGEYEVGIFDDPAAMYQLIREKDEEHGLSRVLAGYAWPWKSRKNRSLIDINLGPGAQFQWNTKVTDWVSSATSLDEAGSIHTVQGYDLNYAGVIIGKDLQYDPTEQRLIVSRSDYHDAKGKANNSMAGQTTTDKMLLEYIINIYTVLLTRGIKGTYLHIVNPALRDYLGRFFPVFG